MSFNVYGNAFSENSRNINEKGTYWGISIKPNRKHKFNAYYDRFQFPWLKFRTESPSIGQEWLIRYSFFPQKRISLISKISPLIDLIYVSICPLTWSLTLMDALMTSSGLSLTLLWQLLVDIALSACHWMGGDTHHILCPVIIDRKESS